MRKRLLKIFLVIAIIFAVLSANQYYYLKKVQYTCTEKINRGEKLNFYEVCSAMQTHTAFWMFGWAIEPNTAHGCFKKQFHLRSSFLTYPILEDEVVKKAQKELRKRRVDKIRLTWKNYESPASIYLNGSYISIFDDEFSDGYLYEIDFDYKPGIIKIAGVEISETVFDYLENRGILSTYKEYRRQRVEK